MPLQRGYNCLSQYGSRTIFYAWIYFRSQATLAFQNYASALPMFFLGNKMRELLSLATFSINPASSVSLANLRLDQCRNAFFGNFLAHSVCQSAWQYHWHSPFSLISWVRVSIILHFFHLILSVFFSASRASAALSSFAFLSLAFSIQTNLRRLISSWNSYSYASWTCFC